MRTRASAGERNVLSASLECPYRAFVSYLRVWAQVGGKLGVKRVAWRASVVVADVYCISVQTLR